MRSDLLLMLLDQSEASLGGLVVQKKDNYIHRGTYQPSPKPFHSLCLRRSFEVSWQRIGVHLDSKTEV